MKRQKEVYEDQTQYLIDLYNKTAVNVYEGSTPGEGDIFGNSLDTGTSQDENKPGEPSQEDTTDNLQDPKTSDKSKDKNPHVSDNVDNSLDNLKDPKTSDKSKGKKPNVSDNFANPLDTGTSQDESKVGEPSQEDTPDNLQDPKTSGKPKDKKPSVSEERKSLTPEDKKSDKPEKKTPKPEEKKPAKPDDKRPSTADAKKPAQAEDKKSVKPGEKKSSTSETKKSVQADDKTSSISKVGQTKTSKSEEGKSSVKPEGEEKTGKKGKKKKKGDKSKKKKKHTDTSGDETEETDEEGSSKKGKKKKKKKKQTSGTKSGDEEESGKSGKSEDEEEALKKSEEDKQPAGPEGKTPPAKTAGPEGKTPPAKAGDEEKSHTPVTEKLIELSEGEEQKLPAGSESEEDKSQDKDKPVRSQPKLPSDKHSSDQDSGPSDQDLPTVTSQEDETDKSDTETASEKTESKSESETQSESEGAPGSQIPSIAKGESGGAKKSLKKVKFSPKSGVSDAEEEEKEDEEEQDDAEKRRKKAISAKDKMKTAEEEEREKEVTKRAKAKMHMFHTALESRKASRQNIKSSEKAEKPPSPIKKEEEKHPGAIAKKLGKKTKDKETKPKSSTHQKYSLGLRRLKILEALEKYKKSHEEEEDPDDELFDADEIEELDASLSMGEKEEADDEIPPSKVEAKLKDVERILSHAEGYGNYPEPDWSRPTVEAATFMLDDNGAPQIFPSGPNFRCMDEATLGGILMQFSKMSLERLHHYAFNGEFMYALFRDRKLVDVLVHVENRLFYAHRSVLCAHSGYFSSVLVDNGIPPYTVTDITLKSVNAGLFKRFLHFAYTGSLFVSLSSLPKMKKLAQKLKSSTLRAKLGVFMSKLGTLSLEEALEILCFNLDVDERPIALEVVKQNFQLVLNDIPSLIRFKLDDMVDIVSSSNICVNSELDIFWAIIFWVAVDSGNRVNFLAKLMSHVRFTTMSSLELLDCARVSEMVRLSPACKKMLLTANWACHAREMGFEDPLNIPLESRRYCLQARPPYEPTVEEFDHRFLIYTKLMQLTGELRFPRLSLYPDDENEDEGDTPPEGSSKEDLQVLVQPSAQKKKDVNSTDSKTGDVSSPAQGTPHATQADGDVSKSQKEETSLSHADDDVSKHKETSPTHADDDVSKHKETSPTHADDDVSKHKETSPTHADDDVSKHKETSPTHADDDVSKHKETSPTHADDDVSKHKETSPTHADDDVSKHKETSPTHAEDDMSKNEEGSPHTEHTAIADSEAEHAVNKSENKARTDRLIHRQVSDSSISGEVTSSWGVLTPSVYNTNRNMHQRAVTAPTDKHTLRPKPKSCLSAVPLTETEMEADTNEDISEETDSLWTDMDLSEASEPVLDALQLWECSVTQMKDAPLLSGNILQPVKLNKVSLTRKHLHQP